MSAALMVKRGGGRYCVATRDEVLQVAAQYQVREMRGPCLNDPGVARQFLGATLGPRQSETFGVLWLDNRHRVIAWVELFQGTLDRASVFPREVLRSCMEHNASACILAHNHPSGILEASNADEIITKRLVQTLGLIDVRVLDHIIAAGGPNCGQTMSFSERGLI
jgi:DNA repair protein RadC